MWAPAGPESPPPSAATALPDFPAGQVVDSPAGCRIQSAPPEPEHSAAVQPYHHSPCSRPPGLEACRLFRRMLTELRSLFQRTSAPVQGIRCADFRVHPVNKARSASCPAGSCSAFGQAAFPKHEASDIGAFGRLPAKKFLPAAQSPVQPGDDTPVFPFSVIPIW